MFLIPSIYFVVYPFKIQTLFWLTYDVEQAGHLGEDQHFVFTRHQPGDSPCVSILRFENLNTH